MPDNETMLAMAIGELKGVMVGVQTSLDKNTEAVEKHTERLAEGDKRISTLEDGHAALPCIKGQPLPSACPALTTQAVPLPAPLPADQEAALEADAAKWRWLVSSWAWFRLHWHWFASGGIALGGLFGGKLGKLADSIGMFLGGNSTH